MTLSICFVNDKIGVVVVPRHAKYRFCLISFRAFNMPVLPENFKVCPLCGPKMSAFWLVTFAWFG